MPCRSLRTGYKKPGGGVTFGQRRDSLGRYGLLTFRCGVCRDCRLYRAREWAIRCYHEAQMHTDNCFLTLTFETDPGSIAKRDLQKFFRRMRDAGEKFRYFAVGEYGEQFTRPHYHVCLFGMDFPDRYPWKRTPAGNLVWRSAKLEKYWKWGFAHIGELTQESAGYAARYSMKKITGDVSEMHYKRDFNGYEISVQPEFALMSKHPAIGLQWLQKNWREVFPADEVIYKGKVCPVPGYYMRWLEANEPAVFEIVKANRIEHYRDQEYETGRRQHQRAQARDGSINRLQRSYENDSQNV